MQLPLPQTTTRSKRSEDEWLWGWDPTPGIVSVWAEDTGRATVWRRLPDNTLVREHERYRPWLLYTDLADLRQLGRYVRHIRELPTETILALPPEEQYLVATGRTYFRDLSFDQLNRLQFDLETTGLDPEHDRIFMIAARARVETWCDTHLAGPSCSTS